MNKKNRELENLLHFILIACMGQFFFCSTVHKTPAQKLDLSGIWRIQIKTNDMDKKNQSPLPNNGTIRLPGTLDENHIGYQTKMLKK